MEGNERRKFIRVLFNTTAKIVASSSVYDTNIFDLSLKGALVGIPNNFNAKLGNIIILEIPLDSNEIIKMETEIIYQKDDVMGLKCTHIDIDSITHLKRIIELNTTKPNEILERDISNLISNI